MVRYFREGIERGFSVEILKKNLLNNGFKEKEIKDAIKALPSNYKYKSESLSKIDEHIKKHTYQNIPKKICSLTKISTILLKPKTFFESSKEESIKSAYKHLAIISIIPILIALIASIFFANFIFQHIPSSLDFFISDSIFSILFSLLLAFIILFYIIIPIKILAYTGLVYLYLRLMKVKGYKDTLTTITYSTTPSIILGFIPLVNFISWIWAIILSIIGLSIVHKISKFESFIAILLSWLTIIMILTLVYSALLYYVL